MAKPIDTNELGPIKIDPTEVVPEGCRQVGWLITGHKASQHFVDLDNGLKETHFKRGWTQKPLYVRN